MRKLAIAHGLFVVLMIVVSVITAISTGERDPLTILVMTFIIMGILALASNINA